MFFSWFAKASHPQKTRKSDASAARKAPKERALRVETLETRALLSVSMPGFAVTDLKPHIVANGASAMATSGPTGYTPTQIRAAYGLATASGVNNINFNGTPGDGTGTTIAIVDAYDDPNIQADLHTFDAQFGLSDPVFTEVKQSGITPNSGWATEISLDVEWAHAIAPKAKILLVEAANASMSALMSAVRTAAQDGANVVSMSWGGGESSGESSYDSYFNTPGVTYLASSGDSGAPASYPAVSPNVVSVGGTTLYLNGSYAITSESGWSDSGGGISAYESQPTYQNGVVTQTSTRRANPDVAYDADPNTGFPVYDSYRSSGWGQWGGTSDAAPQWAAMIAIADQGRGAGNSLSSAQTLALLYSSTIRANDFHDITSGQSVGSPTYSAGTGYDLVTGLGSPKANLLIPALAGTTIVNPPPALPATHFVVSAPTSVTANSATSITITALDQNNNTVAGYLGTVNLAVSGGTVNGLPASYAFTTADNGSHTFTNVTFVTPNSQTTITATDAASSSVTGKATVTVNPAPVATTTTIENFEGGSPGYYVAGSWTGNFSLSSSAVHDGTYGLLNSNGSDWIYRTDSAAQVKAGDTLSVWLKFAGSADGRAYFGFGSSATGTLSLVAAPNTGQLILQNNAGYGFTNMAVANQTWQPNTWYRLEVDWSTSGKIVGKVFTSDGATLLGTVSASTTSITAGGFAFRGTGSNKYWDTVTRTPGVNSFTLPAASNSTAAAAASLPGLQFGWVTAGNSSQGQGSNKLRQELLDLLFAQGWE